MGARRLLAVGVTAALAATVMATVPEPAAAASPCSATPTRTVAGPQSSAFTTSLAANERVDAESAAWRGTISYPVDFDAGADSCWDGGTITGTWGPATTWSSYHNKTGFSFRGPRFTLDHPRIFNTGDAINVDDGSDDFLIRGAYLSYIHDDCIQNDDLLSGTVTDSYLDGCYVAFSARRSDGTNYDGHLNTWTITNSLVRLQAMPKVYKGTAAGHGGFFKWDDSAPLSPKLNISNTIFRADQETNHQDLNLPTGYDVTCSNNTMVWLGDGPFPGSLPSCFTVTTDRTVWDDATALWRWTHPTMVTGPTASIGDASVIEGSSGARYLRFPISLNVGPGTGKEVSVYWATAPGSAGTSDFATTRGKVVFKGSQVHKTVSVKVTPDSKSEGDETMHALIAGVDGGVNGRERGTGTIVDDDPGSGIRLAVSDQFVVEGNNGVRNLVIPITLTQPAAANVVLHYSTQNGTAVAGSDFVAKSRSLTIKSSRRFANVTVRITPNTTAEALETFRLVVDSVTNATVIDDTGVITIQDDD